MNNIYKCKIVAVADGECSGYINLTQKEFDLVERVLDVLGDEVNESYSPLVYIEKVKENER